jgi:xylulokinase
MTIKDILLGLDIGSSFVKASLLEASTGVMLKSASSPAEELSIISKTPGWAEQNPLIWWENVVTAARTVISADESYAERIAAIGISYQMHGLVLVGKELTPLRPAIIWCDSRAVEIGNQAFSDLGANYCYNNLMNSPGNFTASKLAWVKRNEPEIYKKAVAALLPGDYIALQLTGQLTTSALGLSEGIMWDYQKRSHAKELFDYYQIDQGLIPELVPTFAVQGELCSAASSTLGLPKGVVVSYRAGDQPNNAWSLKVLEPGEVAATAGTSGVVYFVNSGESIDRTGKTNTFLHVTNTAQNHRYGGLMCLNGAGIFNRWARDITGAKSYEQMNDLATQSPAGANGLHIFPYGNGAERSLGNRYPRASMHQFDFNIHTNKDLYRSVQESIVFALKYGIEHTKVNVVRAGHANMFLSPLFGRIFADVLATRVELFHTDGAQGAARGAGVGAGVYPDYQSAFVGLEERACIDPSPSSVAQYKDIYGKWRERLQHMLEIEN